MFNLLEKGLRFADYNNEKVFHISLTTDNGVNLDIVYSLELLLESIYKVVGRFKFFYVITDEGCGVVHLLLNEVYLPIEWFSNHWSRIHKSYIVRRFMVDYSRFEDLCVYLATQENIMDIGCACDWMPTVEEINEVSYIYKSSVDGKNKRLF